MSRRTCVIHKHITNFDWERTESIAVCSNTDEANAIVDWLERNTNTEGKDYNVSYGWLIADEVTSLKDFKRTYEDDDLVEV